MSELWQTTLFLVIGTWLASLTAGGIGMFINVVQRLSRLESPSPEIGDFNNRLIIIETILKMAERNIIKAMHRDGDEYGMDALVDKYVAGNSDLPLEDWIKVKRLATSLMSDKSKDSAERALFGLVAAFAAHKLMRFEAISQDLEARITAKLKEHDE